MKRVRIHLGVFYAGAKNSEAVDAPVLGANVSASAMFRAIISHGALDSLDVSAGSSNIKSVRDEIAEIVGRRGRKTRNIRVSGIRDLAAAMDRHAPTVLHSFGGSLTQHYYLRENVTHQPFPITSSLPDALSYQFLLHERFLRDLLFGRECDAIVTPSRASRDIFVSYLDHVSKRFNQRFGTKLKYKGRTEIVPLGVDTDLFRPREKTRLRRQLSLPHDGLIILWFGRPSLSNKMDLLPLIRMFQGLLEDNPKRKLFFVIASSNDKAEGYAEMLRKYVNIRGLGKNVLFRSDIPISTRHLVFPASDIFVSPVDNIQETFGITPIEAMASGIPQVVADWNGYRDTVVHGETGFLVPTSWMPCMADLSQFSGLLPTDVLQFSLAQSVAVDMEAYRSSLQLLIDNRALRHRMSVASRKRSVQCFDWKVVIGRYMEIWEELVQRSTRLRRATSVPQDYNCLPFWEIYQRYPAKVVSEESEVRLTEDGVGLIERKEALPVFPFPYSEYLDHDLVTVLLGVLVGSEKALVFRKLIDAASREVHRPKDVIRRHLMWLLKYGFVVVKPA